MTLQSLCALIGDFNGRFFDSALLKEPWIAADGEPGAPLHAAICEWQQAGSAAGRSIRKVETMKISVRQGCPTGTAGARTALQWIRNNAE